MRRAERSPGASLLPRLVRPQPSEGAWCGPDPLPRRPPAIPAGRRGACGNSSVRPAGTPARACEMLLGAAAARAGSGRGGSLPSGLRGPSSSMRSGRPPHPGVAWRERLSGGLSRAGPEAGPGARPGACRSPLYFNRSGFGGRGPHAWPGTPGGVKPSRCFLPGRLHVEDDLAVFRRGKVVQPGENAQIELAWRGSFGVFLPSRSRITPGGARRALHLTGRNAAPAPAPTNCDRARRCCDD